MIAVALCSGNLSLKILGSLYIKINKPMIPTKFFDDREKGKAWLKGFIQ
jgi:hypothetical protein